VDAARQDRYRDAHRSAIRHTVGHADRYRYGDPHGHCNSDGHLDLDADANHRHRDPYAHRHRDTVTHANLDANGNGDAHCDIDHPGG
jgi:hypothetical protein